MISNCTCEHEAQDRIHGKGKRVFNSTLKGKAGPTVYRCTVCLKEKTANEPRRDERKTCE